MVLTSIRSLNASSMTRQRLGRIKDVIVDLARDRSLFPLTDFPAPAAGHSVLYRLAQDPDDRLALYLQTGLAGNRTPPHNYGTWAVIASITGNEDNTIDDGLDAGNQHGVGSVKSSGRLAVKPVTAIALMPTDIHSINLDDARPAMQLHVYGTPIEKMTDRVWFDLAKGTTAHFEAHPNIVDFRQ